MTSIGPTSRQKSRYPERVYIQYIYPMLPQGRSKQTVTPYNTMQDHITRFCTNNIIMYACFLIKVLHFGKSRVANTRLALQSLVFVVTSLTFVVVFVCSIILYVICHDISPSIKILYWRRLYNMLAVSPWSVTF